MDEVVRKVHPCDWGYHQLKTQKVGDNRLTEKLQNIAHGFSHGDDD
jgi:hypothetical protein